MKFDSYICGSILSTFTNGFQKLDQFDPYVIFDAKDRKKVTRCYGFVIFSFTILPPVL